MSLMKSLARVAAGVMLAKGIGAVMKNAQNRQGQGGSRPSSGGLSSGGLLDDLLGSNTGGGGNRNTGSGGLADMLGQVLGGRSGGACRYPIHRQLMSKMHFYHILICKISILVI